MSPLRKDARRNRELLVEAARRLFAGRGLGVPLEEIARAAGVSIGTLYNRFPQRADLVDAVFADRVETVERIAEHALTMPDPWEGFVHFLERICELQAADRGFNDLASRRPPGDGLELMTRIVDRAKDSGALRADFTLGDVAFLTWSTARTVEVVGAVRPDLWRRHLGIMLDGLRASAAHPLAEPPISPEHLGQAMAGEC
ncbi:TetR/AcrR family transcriptional regulator [Saccharothrix violaceirubra]|uniref:AcrR family transcriptional regulator n=1 Tax=Saccharothrix violaceirubra TaxID=413306 RepID=A0A7W7T551_9PSEU|nr:helix-turn-helix domain-containing protein [Saccharothrix violaceirubra]MBB4966177.1 AcrR family transcriptional regulator [Saccharothrix violaceirubra]